MIEPSVISTAISGFWKAYRPNDGKQKPAILLLHGSDGGNSGWNDKRAIFFAAHGYLAVPYQYSTDSTAWDAGRIEDFDLSDTARALGLIRKDASCNGKIGLFGVSRGAEHALLLASLMANDKMENQADCVIAHACSNVIWAAFDSKCTRPEDDPSHLKWDVARHAWQWNRSSVGLEPGTAIEIEKFEGPVMLSHGEEDQLWSCDMTRKLEKRLIAAGRKPEVRYFENEGHGFSARAENQFNTLALNFLKRTLH